MKRVANADRQKIIHTRALVAVFSACCVVGWNQLRWATKHSARGAICVDFNGADYVAIVKTKTAPSFYISLHREKDDTPRAPIMYTGMYYETEKTLQIRKLMTMSDGRMDGMFLDVGANIGWFTLSVAALGRQVVAFEPNPKNVMRIKHSVQANEFGNVFLKPFGAGPSNAVMQFRERETNLGMGTFLDNLTDHGDKITEIPVKRVDDELKSLPRRWKRRIALVKIDVEGFEAGALKGMLGTLQKDQPLVYIEFNNELPSSDDYYDSVWSFVQLGYRVWGNDDASFMDNSLGELRVWFDAVVHMRTSPSDFLFLPKWIKDEDMPF